MKKLLLLLVFTNFAFSQNIELLKQATKCDALFAKKFSEEIAKSLRIKYVFFDELISQRGKASTMVFIPENSTEEQKKSLRAHMDTSLNTNNFESTGNLSVHFSIQYDGENKDLEIKGIPIYRFENVEAKFLDLFDFWKNNVDPTADKEKISQKGISAIRKNEDGYWINFSRKSNGENWYIQNYTHRINE
jgi:hypothetical protein